MFTDVDTNVPIVIMYVNAFAITHATKQAIVLTNVHMFATVAITIANTITHADTHARQI